MSGKVRYIVLIAVALIAGFFVLRARVTPHILDAHTKIVFQQFEMAYGDSLKAGQARVESREQFLNRISQWNIDWNSCELRGNAVLDSWGTPIDIQMEKALIKLRSAGPDHLFGTPDDIMRNIAN